MPEAATSPVTETAPRPAKLDDVMIAMDVVDTLRHREDLVRRELDETAREAELIERLREIYRQQGIDVPDSVLAEGVKALKDSRFTYSPPPPSWRRTAFEMWTRRRTVGRWAAIAVAAIVAWWAYQYFAVTRPQLVAEEQARIELTETLPARIRQAHADIARTATDPAARTRADALLADGERTIRDKDRTAMQRIAGQMAEMRDAVAAEYVLTIVSRPGETTGLWRRPPRGGQGGQARNYYLIVEPVAPDGRKLTLPILNEETGQTRNVDRFGVRVPQATYDAVRADKSDDGILQSSRFGVKRRGTLTVEYLMPYAGGTITDW